jgi:hypothetical protein
VRCGPHTACCAPPQIKMHSKLRCSSTCLHECLNQQRFDQLDCRLPPNCKLAKFCTSCDATCPSNANNMPCLPPTNCLHTQRHQAASLSSCCSSCHCPAAAAACGNSIHSVSGNQEKSEHAPHRQQSSELLPSLLQHNSMPRVQCSLGVTTCTVTLQSHSCCCSPYRLEPSSTSLACFRALKPSVNAPHASSLLQLQHLQSPCQHAQHIHHRGCPTQSYHPSAAQQHFPRMLQDLKAVSKRPPHAPSPLLLQHHVADMISTGPCQTSQHMHHRACPTQSDHARATLLAAAQ